MKFDFHLERGKIQAAILILVLAAASAWPAVTVPQKGVTFGDWLTPAEAYHVQSTRYSKADFEAVKSLGFDHVRIPVNFKTSSCVAPDYTVDPIFIKMLDKAVAWAEETGLKIVIANDSKLAAGTESAFLTAVWKQVAARYKDKGDFLLYDVYSEPGLPLAFVDLNPVLAALIAEINAVDNSHAIIVTSWVYGHPSFLDEMQKFDATNVVYGFHMTLPWIFTYQGGEMPDGIAMVTTGIPFPYDAARMPVLDPADASLSELTTYYNDYPTYGTVAFVQQIINSMWANNSYRFGPLMCMSFGAPYDNIPAADREAYIAAVREGLDAKGIPWTYGGFRGGWGIYDQDSEEVMPWDVTNSVMTALGLAPPSKTPPLEITALDNGFVIYDDAAGPGIRTNWYLGDIGEPNYWSTQNPKDGEYCLDMMFPGQWNAINFAWHPVRDMSGLVGGGYALDLWFRCDNPTADIDLRFEDSNIDFEDHPWRMNKRLTDSVVPFDGEWQHVQIPLSDFEDMGAWDPDDQTWYNPEGIFDWTMVQTFQLVSETQVQQETELFFDNIRVVDPTAVEDRKAPEATFVLAANYPNPFNPSTEIRYALPSAWRVTLTVYNLKGERIRILADGTLPAGNHRVLWDGLDSNGAAVPSGVYVYRLESGGLTQSRRMVLMR
jgi:endoglucanase